MRHYTYRITNHDPTVMENFLKLHRSVGATMHAIVNSPADTVHSGIIVAALQEQPSFQIRNESG